MSPVLTTACVKLVVTTGMLAGSAADWEVAALLEAAAGHLHDARLPFAQVDLVLWTGPGSAGLDGPPPGFLPVCTVRA